MEKKPKKQTAPWLKFSSMGLQMGLIIYFAHLIGVWLDNKYGTESFSYDKGLTLFAVFGSTYSVIRQVIKMSNEEDKK